MADFIEQQGQPQGAPQAQLPEGQIQQNVLQEASAPEMIQAGQPQGSPYGTGLATIEDDPRNAPDEPASEQEQAEYEDLFIRAMAAVNDIRPRPRGQKSMADATIEMLATKDKEPFESIGITAGMTIQNLTEMARRQGKKYSPDVIREVGMDLLIELYEIADKSGAIKNLPPVDSDEGDKIIEQAALEATKVVGEQLIASGEVNQQEHMNLLQHQMQREADSGELDDWGFEQFDEGTRRKIARELGQVAGGRRNGP